MPIALLLQKPFAMLPTLLAAAKALSPWVEIVRAETVLLARARGTFLLNWFGRFVPRQGPYVWVAIANRAELAARLRQVLSVGSPTAGAASVINPLAALIGVIAGTALSPMGQIAGISLIVRFQGFGVTALLWAVAALTGVIFAVAMGGLTAVGVGGSLLALVFFPDQVEQVLALAALAARAMNAITGLVRQLLGPREAVRNPLLKAVLGLGDQLGALGASLLGAVAFAVDRIGPRLVAIARTVVGIRQTVEITVAAVDAVIDTAQSDGRRFTDGDWAITPFFTRFTTVAAGVIATVGKAISNGIDLARITIMLGRDELSAHLELYVGGVQRYRKRVFDENPTVKTIHDLTKLMRDKNNDAPETQQPGLFARMLPKVELPDPAKLLKQAAAQPIPPLTWEAIERKGTTLAPAELTPGAPARLLLALRAGAALAGMAQRPSIFAAERAPRTQALTENRVALTALTEKMVYLVGRFLTPALWERLAPQMAPAVDKFVALIYPGVPAPPAAERPLPVRRPDEPVPVRPVIATLRLRSPGASDDDLRALRDRLVPRLVTQSYAVAPVTWGR